MATMFISVSGDLPKTSYIKMVDIWLIFNLIVPFFEVWWTQKHDLDLMNWAQVILHTYIDSLRVDEDREINHHGSSIKVFDQMQLVSTFFFLPGRRSSGFNSGQFTPSRHFPRPWQSDMQEPILKVSEGERPGSSAMYGGNLKLVSRHENIQVANYSIWPQTRNS